MIYNPSLLILFMKLINRITTRISETIYIRNDHNSHVRSLVGISEITAIAVYMQFSLLRCFRIDFAGDWQGFYFLLCIVVDSY